MKTTFIKLLSQVRRPGVEKLLQYLEAETDFYSAPASTKFHGACEEGLLAHSLAVYENLLNLNHLYRLGLPVDSMLITALLHDLCKANFYQKGFRNRKNEASGQWEKVEVYEINDQFPIGHGEKSVILLQRFVELTTEEALAIRWHMGGFDDSSLRFTGMQCLSNAMHKSKLVVALHMADLAAGCFDNK